MDVRVENTDDLVRLGKALKATGDKGLKREVMRALKQAGKPLSPKVKSAARRDLPRRGGLGDIVAKSSVTTSVRFSGKNPGVRIVGSRKGLSLPQIDAGTIRRPTFGRAPWVNQRVKPGWFTETIRDEAPAVRREVVDVLDDMAKRLEKRG